MKIAIIGGRDFDDYQLMIQTLTPYTEMVTCVVSGGAKGADSLGEKWAIENNKETLIHIPDWKSYGKSAGFIRNKDIINDADIIFAFWDGKSKGTNNSIQIAKKIKKEIIIVKYEK
jgi:hypothetical protein